MEGAVVSWVATISWLIRALTMHDSITESKTINYILFMVFC